MRSLRSKGNGSPFTLFAFQDILTTTIGIVLLVMLLLVLEISEADATNEIVSEISNTKFKTATQLQDDIELHIEILSILSNRSPKEAIEWIKEQVQHEQAATEHFIENVFTNIATQQPDPKIDAIKSMHSEINLVSEEIAQLKIEIVSSLLKSPAARELEELRSKRKQLQYQLDGVIANDSLVYIKQDDPNNTPFLVEICEYYITIHGNGVIPGMNDFRLPNKSVADRCDAAVSIIRQLSNKQYYPLLLVQPGGGLQCEIIRDELQNLNITCGVDLLFDAQTTIPDQLIPGAILH